MLGYLLLLSLSLSLSQAFTLMKVYVSHKLYFYLPGDTGATLVPPTANLMLFTGKTLFVSEEVQKGFLEGGWSLC